MRNLWLFLLLLAIAPARANQQVAAGDLVMLYSVVPTLDLAPEVARQYGLTRSSGRALLNIALRRTLADGSDTAVAGTVRAAATNEAGQRQELRLREVREGDAIYYLAEVRVSDGDTLRYELEASVDGSPQPVAVRFSQPYFVPR